MSGKLAINGGARTVPEGFIKPWPEITEADRQAVAEVLSIANIQQQQNIQAEGLANEWSPGCKAEVSLHLLGKVLEKAHKELEKASAQLADEVFGDTEGTP